jgi:hypothetical protein
MIRAESQAEINRINGSRMSEWKKAEAIKSIQEAQKRRDIEAGKRAVAFAMLQGAIAVASATANSWEALTKVYAQDEGGAVKRLVAGATILAAGLSAVAQVKAAQASIPKREHGGLMRANQIYEVAERGKDEMFSAGGRSFMIPSQSGRMTPNVNNSYGGATTNYVSVVVNGDGNPREIEGAILNGLYSLDRSNRIDYGKLPNMRRAFA